MEHLCAGAIGPDDLRAEQVGARGPAEGRGGRVSACEGQEEDKGEAENLGAGKHELPHEDLYIWESAIWKFSRYGEAWRIVPSQVTDRE